MGDISKNFSRSEFACNCGKCGQATADVELIGVLETARAYFNAPVFINSGHRCASYNKKVGGATNSEHLKGWASDIRVGGISPNEVADYLQAKYPGKYGIGRYATFTHIDMRPTPARWRG